MSWWPRILPPIASRHHRAYSVERLAARQAARQGGVLWPQRDTQAGGARSSRGSTARPHPLQPLPSQTPLAVRACAGPERSSETRRLCAAPPTPRAPRATRPQWVREPLLARHSARRRVRQMPRRPPHEAQMQPREETCPGRAAEERRERGARPQLGQVTALPLQPPPLQPLQRRLQGLALSRRARQRRSAARTQRQPPCNKTTTWRGHALRARARPGLARTQARLNSTWGYQCMPHA